MNFWTFLDRNGFGLFWLAALFIGTTASVIGVVVGERPKCPDPAPAATAAP